ncbi:MAG TPA: nickel-dependent hydrogenase large subunit [Gallionella sp.]|nr:nickel-dependent hydrogenase large subunit [Gallionella sp.]
MPDAGGVDVRIAHDGKAVTGVEVKSSRPQAYRVLAGRPAEDAVRMIPLLYSVCGKAQRAAAGAAVAAARGEEPAQIGTLERAVWCEALQEHLWRLLLDWPQQLGLPQRQQLFVRWHNALAAIAAGQGDAQKLLAELERNLLGMTVAEWQQIDSYAALGERLNRGNGFLAPVIAALAREEDSLEFVAAPALCALMPHWSAREVCQLHADRFDPEFAAVPQHDGKPMETGALAYWQHTPLLQEVLRQRPARLQARLLARMTDLLDGAVTLASGALAKGEPQGRIQGIAAGDGRGLAVVQTARGMLVHYVRLDTDRVAEYLTVAPTEWNFHPQGALASGLAGLRECDAERLQATVRNYVLSLDPCVEYRIEVAHA